MKDANDSFPLVPSPSISLPRRTLTRRSSHWVGAVLTALWLVMALPVSAQDNMEIVPININEASLEVLVELPGIGPSKAQSILDDREANGPFTSLEDLKRVSGIGDAIVERLEGEVSF